MAAKKAPAKKGASRDNMDSFTKLTGLSKKNPSAKKVKGLDDNARSISKYSNAKGYVAGKKATPYKKQRELEPGVKSLRNQMGKTKKK